MMQLISICFEFKQKARVNRKNTAKQSISMYIANLIVCIVFIVIICSIYNINVIKLSLTLLYDKIYY